MHDRTALISAASFPAYRFSPLWKKSALAAAAALTLLGVHPNADALGLGAVQVQSFLGEPLRAEVEVPDITSEEAAAFQVTLGTPQEFQAAGVDYSEALRGLRITLSRRPNGQAYLRVLGQQPVNEPFLGIVINASWGNGHVVRDYTLLIDPPRQRAGASAAPPAQRENAPVITSKPRRESSGAAGVAAEPGKTTGGASAPGEGQQVRVQPGDTATSILEAHQAEGVSLDQMLLALLRANPNAFIHGNVNLIRAGAVVNLPSAEQATAVSPALARRLLIVQSRDFRAYREGLAKTATRGGQMAAGRHSATGSVQAQVREINAAPTPQDRLTLSRGQPGAGQASGSGSGTAGRAEASAAQSRQVQEQATRQAELQRNIKELSQLAETGGNAAAAASAAKPSAPAINIPASTAVAAAPSAPVEVQRTASAPATAAAPRSPAPLPLKPSFVDALLDSWPTLAGMAAIVLLLGGYAFYRGRKKEEKNHRQPRVDSDLNLDSGSNFSPDSYFGADGGQHVDTRDTHSHSSNADAGSSMNYSPSQLEAVGDIDPVSEADVYLAYGRDAQAEEILKEALRAYPGRVSIYVKLAEIYAKQRDTRQLAAIATEARRVTHGEGHDWQAIVNLGSHLDPENPLYASGGAPAASDPPITQPPGSPGVNPNAQDRMAPNVASTPAPQSIPPQPAGGFAQTALTSMPAPLGAAVPAATEPMLLPASQRASTPAASASSHTDISFTPPAPPQPRQAQAGDSGMMAFDPVPFSASPAARPAKAGAKSEDPLATKLALAQEFHAIGDDSSARSLVKEVIAEATGAMKTKAEQFLNDLS